jgi:hypothetical protein
MMNLEGVEGSSHGLFRYCRNVSPNRPRKTRNISIGGLSQNFNLGSEYRVEVLTIAL